MFHPPKKPIEVSSHITSCVVGVFSYILWGLSFTKCLSFYTIHKLAGSQYVFLGSFSEVSTCEECRKNELSLPLSGEIFLPLP